MRNVSGGEIEIIADGQRTSLVRNSYIESRSKPFEFTWHGDGRPHWIRIDVRDEASHLALLGNPIYLSGNQ